MKLATPEAFARNPQEVHAFYNARRRNLITAKPNAAHFALTRLETALAERGGNLTLVTQNIDHLHERAGSERVIHMHGELLKARCTACEAVSPWRKDLGLRDQCSACKGIGVLRPHVVWFGEMPFQIGEIYAALNEADLFVAIGTSSSVYPAAGFVYEARALGIRTCEIRQTTQSPRAASICRRQARKMIAFLQQIGQKIGFLRLYIACDWIELEPRRHGRRPLYERLSNSTVAVCRSSLCRVSSNTLRQ
jgi:NAD-dependent deacetylase